MKWQHFVLAVLFSFAFLNCTVQARSYTTVTWYMRNDIVTVNGVAGYHVNATQASNTSTYIFESVAYTSNASWGWRIYYVDNANQSYEMTTAVSAIVTRSSDDAGLQSATWTPANTSLEVGWYSIKFILYRRWNSSTSWIAKGTFTTDRQMYRQIGSGAWTFYLYTQRITGTNFYVRWAHSSYNTRVTSVKLLEPYPWEVQLYHIQNGDFILMITFPYTNLIGTSFYGLIMLLICVPLWNRYHSFKPILFSFIIFGGPQGIFSLFVPEIGMPIGWIFCLLGLAGLLYQVTR